MHYKGESGGFAFWRFDPPMDENTWTLQVGFGGRADPPPREGYLDPLYRFQFSIQWRPLATCFQWWCEFLGVETQWHHHKGIHTKLPPMARYQYRIYSFERWPIAVTYAAA